MVYIVGIIVLIIMEIIFYCLKLNYFNLMKKILIVGDVFLPAMIIFVLLLKNDVEGLEIIICGLGVEFLFYTIFSYPKLKKDEAIYRAIQRSGFWMIFRGDYNDINISDKKKLADKIKKIYWNHGGYSKKSRYTIFLRDKKEIYLLFAFSSIKDYEIFKNNIDNYAIEGVEKSGRGMMCEMRINLADV